MCMNDDDMLSQKWLKREHSVIESHGCTSLFTCITLLYKTVTTLDSWKSFENGEKYTQFWQFLLSILYYMQE